MKLLILTDHKNHSAENSLYELAKAMLQDKHANSVAVATRENTANLPFFNGGNSEAIYVNEVTNDFAFTENGAAFQNGQMVSPHSYDAIWLRMPPPLTKDFLDFLTIHFPDQVIINNPMGIYKTGSKEFLVNFQEVSPTMRICKTMEDIISFKKQFPIVLKPFREYGGKGIVRIDGEKVWEGKDEMTFTDFAERMKDKEIAYLAVKFLKNVDQGDKRIIVVAGEIMGASLRLPAKDSWLCNVAMGGSSHDTSVSPEEIEIVKRIDPALSEMGIVMYGVDTLMGDDGKRILSEINTTSIGGLPQVARLRGEPLLEKAADLIWKYIVKKINKMNVDQQMDVPTIRELNISNAPKGQISRYWLHIATDGMGVSIKIPIIVARGHEDGKVLGLTAAVHGNELNGIPVIQRIFKELDVTKLKGTIVGVPVVNVPSLLRKKRRFIDGADLNHIMPGKEDGNVSSVYAWRFFNRVVRQFNYLVDLHTASNGRVNSYYVRADMGNETVRKMALLQNAQIIVNNPPNDGTLRGAAEEIGVPSITLEVGNPNTFQKGLIRDGLTGIHNLLGYLGMVDCEVEEHDEETVLCKRSYWIFSDTGGILTTFPQVTDLVKKGEVIATMRNMFGDLLKEYKAPEDGIVIGKSVSPINQTGGRILHLGIV